MKKEKAPADQFYWSDWIRDVELQLASATTRGVWMNILCHMWFSNTRGELTGTTEKLAILANATEAEFNQFLREAETLGFCYTSRNHNGNITLRNRRMWRKEKQREKNRLRQQRYYKKRKHNGKSDGDLTTPSPSPTPRYIPYRYIVECLNRHSEKNFKHTSKETQRLIRARFNQGFTKSDFEKVIKLKCAKWKKDPKMIDFLRPSTLFGTNFEAYLNEIPASQDKKKDPFKGSKFLRDVYDMMLHPGYSDQDIDDHIKGFGQDPKNIRRKINGIVKR